MSRFKFGQAAQMTRAFAIYFALVWIILVCMMIGSQILRDSAYLESVNYLNMFLAISVGYFGIVTCVFVSNLFSSS